MTTSRRYIWVEDRRATRLPYSKFVMASSMMVVGVEPEVAYPLAESIEEELMARPGDHVRVDEVVGIALEALENAAGPGPAARYAAWVEVRRRGRPILVLLGGATGVGKSSVAAEVGARLRINTVLPSDAIRDVMRQILPAPLAGILHVSSFEADEALRAPVPDDHDAVLVAFRQQAEVVATGIRGLVNRALREETDLVMEGVHVIPGLFDADLDEWRERAAVTHAMLGVADPGVHRAHFLTRLERSPGRVPQRYLDRFQEIRRIERYLRRTADAAGTPVVEMAQLDDAIQAVVGMVVDELIGSV